MDREILFRGKRVDNGEWIRGDLITTPFVRNETQQNIIYILDITKADYDCFEDLTEDNGYFEVDPSTVCQYTGLTDRNGNKIFEGDILREDNAVKEEFCVVRFGVYGAYHLGFHVDWHGDCLLRKELRYWADRVSVTGNIFDSPGLMEGD